MTSIVTKGRKSLASAALAIGITLGFASPAQAETITYTCEGEFGTPARQGNWTVDIDFGASTVKFASHPVAPAVITDREITFNYQAASGRIQGRIDRLAGIITAWWYSDRVDQGFIAYEARCRRATIKI